MTTYRAHRGAAFSHADAQQIGEAVERIGDEVTPDDVVEAARNTSSPLHRLFEWDDTLAAVRWRRQEARSVLNHLSVVVKMPDGNLEPIKAFHSVDVQTDDDTMARRYVHVSIVKERPDFADDVVDRARGELESWRNRYRGYREFFGSVFSAIDNVVTTSAGTSARQRRV